MENIKTFLETASINGLAHIASTRRNIRVFWVTVVVSGFIASGVMIKESFQSWAESPVKTTIETFPITEITFPKVTVCPPKNTFTDLNHDLMVAENITLTNDTRHDLNRLAIELLYEDLFEEFKENVSIINIKDRYYNWYHGYSGIDIPYPYYDTYLMYYYEPYTESGTVSTKYFGEKFNVEKVRTNMHVIVSIYPPEDILFNGNVTLNLEIENVLMKQLTSGEDRFWVASKDWTNYHQIGIKRETFNPPIEDCGYGDYCVYHRDVILKRKVAFDDVEKMNLKLTPGFRLKWYYTGIEETQVKSQAFYRNSDFTRKYFIILFNKDKRGGSSYFLKIKYWK